MSVRVRAPQVHGGFRETDPSHGGSPRSASAGCATASELTLTTSSCSREVGLRDARLHPRLGLGDRRRDLATPHQLEPVAARNARRFKLRARRGPRQCSKRRPIRDCSYSADHALARSCRTRANTCSVVLPDVDLVLYTLQLRASAHQRTVFTVDTSGGAHALLATRSAPAAGHLRSRMDSSCSRSLRFARRIAVAMIGAASFPKPDGSPRFRNVIRVWPSRRDSHV
jgi:hypothetical protein